MGKRSKGKSKRTRRTFTDDFKRDAVNLVVVEGYSFQRAADAVGVNSRSIREWYEKFAPPAKQRLSNSWLKRNFYARHFSKPSWNATY